MPRGERHRLLLPYEFGILDHRVVVDGDADVLVTMRMVTDGDGTEVELVPFRQPVMADADCKRDAHMAKADLQAVNALLEAEARRRAWRISLARPPA